MFRACVRRRTPKRRPSKNPRSTLDSEAAELNAADILDLSHFLVLAKRRLIEALVLVMLHVLNGRQRVRSRVRLSTLPSSTERERAATPREDARRLR